MHKQISFSLAMAILGFLVGVPITVFAIYLYVQGGELIASNEQLLFGTADGKAAFYMIVGMFFVLPAIYNLVQYMKERRRKL